MNWLKSLFGSKNDNTEEETEKSVPEQLTEEILHCTRQKNLAEENINQLEKWAAEAIREVFEVSHHFWYVEHEKYEEIKKQAANKNVVAELVLECDEIVKGYMEQIAFRKSKIKLYETLIEKHQQNLKRYDEAREKIAKQEKMHQASESLSKHRERLQEMQKKTGKLTESITLEEKTKHFEWELRRIEDEYEINKAIEKEMHELENSLGNRQVPDITSAFTDEVDKLVEKIQKSTNNEKS